MQHDAPSCDSAIATPMSESSAGPHLVILTGPVGAGKSTVAQAFAALLRQPSRPVTVIDLDVMYCLLRQREGFGERDIWPLARRASGAVAAVALQRGFHCAVLEGEYFTSEHIEQVTAHGDLPPPALFALKLGYDETLRRVRLDPSRGDSKNPLLLRQFHNAFVAALPFLGTAATVLSAERASVAELAATILAHLPGVSPGRE
jgi:energy-coupling factor transporter ATP-binding protein EcfA2